MIQIGVQIYIGLWNLEFFVQLYSNMDHKKCTTSPLAAGSHNIGMQNEIWSIKKVKREEKVVFLKKIYYRLLSEYSRMSIVIVKVDE